MPLDLTWGFVADGVMGGVSRGAMTGGADGARRFVRLTGDVSLENNGGFIQMAADFREDGGPYDASAYTGLAVTLRGNDDTYDIRLRTDALTRPWQSFRTEVFASHDWTEHRLPFSAFQPHRTTAVFDPSRLRRIGVLAIGREMAADVSVAAVAFYT